MIDEKKTLNDAEVGSVDGGIIDAPSEEWQRYTDPYTPVECPKCKRRDNIWYTPGAFGIMALNQYHCLNCGRYFGHGENNCSGGNQDW